MLYSCLQVCAGGQCIFLAIAGLLCYNTINIFVFFGGSMGNLIVLEGTDGSGKSTLIQHMNGLLKPTEGEIFYNGVNIYSKGYSS